MGNAFKAAVAGDLINIPPAGVQQIPGMVHSFFEQPFARCRVIVLLEISFKRGDAALCDAGELRDGQVEIKVVFHYIAERGFLKIAQVICIS